MKLDETRETTIMQPQGHHTGEVCLVDQERWAESRRLRQDEQVSIAEIGRRLAVDRKTVRRPLRQTIWQPSRRAGVAETLLTAHADVGRARAPPVHDSARILYQALRASRGYSGRDETVKQLVAPLRAVPRQADRALMRFEPPPGQQRQSDWGQAPVPCRAGPTVGPVVVRTLGFSRRGFEQACAEERMAPCLEAHDRACAHCGGHSRAPRDDRPRTVGEADETGRRLWHPPFKACADYGGFAPRVCRPDRAQTKGKVESGVT
jgi:transposase